MKIRLFLEKCDFKSEISFTGDRYNYLINVLRCGINDAVFVFNESQEFEYIVHGVSRKEINLHKISNIAIHENEILPDLGLIFPIIKGDKMIIMLKQAVELGVSHLFPVTTERSLSSTQFNEKRMFSNITEALEQCGGLLLPKLSKPEKLKSLLSKLTDWNIIYGAIATCNMASSFDSNRKKAVLVGPEGGFSNSELEMISQYGNARAFSLGKRIARTETAAIAILCQVKFAIFA